MGGASGVAPAHVVILGAGMAGTNAAWIAAGMEAEVVLLDKNLDRLRWVDQIHRGRIMTIRSGGTETFPERVRAKFAELDLVVPGMVERQLAVIDALTTQIKEADKELKAIATTDEGCRRLMSVPGVGPIVGLRFLTAVDDVARFKDAHHLQSYFGLTPGENSSSDVRRRTHLTRAGSAQVRWTLVQAAWSAMRSRPSDPMVLWAKEIKKRRGASIAATALARKIAGILFAILRNGSTYAPLRASSIRAEDLVSRRCLRLAS